MPAPTVRGNFSSLIKQWQSELVTNDQNKSEYQISWKIHKNNWQAETPDIGDESEDFPGLFLVERRVKLEGVVAEIVGTYRGQLGTAFDRPPAPVYQLSVDGIQNPIQQHPLWEDNNTFPLADKIFDPPGDSTGKFVAFKNSSDFRGIQSYFVTGARWSETRYELTQPNAGELFDVGKRSAPKGLHGYQSGHWLLISRTWSKRGAFWEVQSQWSYSGPDKPWSKAIYGE